MPEKLCIEEIIGSIHHSAFRIQHYLEGVWLLKTVVITGGSRGIGAAAVELFAARGDRVYFLYEKNQEAADTVAEKTGAIPIRCDVARPLREHHGRARLNTRLHRLPEEQQRTRRDARRSGRA